MKNLVDAIAKDEVLVHAVPEIPQFNNDLHVNCLNSTRRNIDRVETILHSGDFESEENSRFVNAMDKRIRVMQKVNLFPNLVQEAKTIIQSSWKKHLSSLENDLRCSTNDIEEYLQF